MVNQLLKKVYITLTFIIVIFCFYSTNIHAQYFGQNKVLYDNFNFKILHTEHFEIYYYQEEADAVKYAARMAERWYARHAAVLRDSLRGPQTLILYDGFPQFQETNVTQGMIGQGTGGFTEPLERRIVLPFAGPLDETNHVIGHELTHAFQFDITSKNKLSKDGLPAASQMPLWFIEGMAEYFSLGPKDVNTAMWMREAALKKLPKISDLDDPKYFPYRYGQAMLAFLGGKYGNEKIGELLRTWARVQNFKTAFDSVFHATPDSVSKLWHIALHAAYDTLNKVTYPPDKYGDVLISDKKNGGDMNISPVLSPDGKKLIFFSSKDLFAIDLYLADAKTGKIIKNVFKTELNTHLQNLEFINSAGAWNPNGKEFVFTATSDGRPIISIINVNTGKLIYETRFPSLAEIFNPAWSPDGRYLAFSALAKGLSNLFLYDLKTDSLTQLTDDPYAELQPVFSPDGKSIAYVTDRFTTKLSDLDFGNYELASYNIKTKIISKLPSFSNGKNINPQWSSDGKSIYFISDQNGIDNIYRANLNTGEINQITNLYGGVSGITALSPALSVASNSNDMVYSVFENNKYAIYSIDSTKILKGKKTNPQFATGNPAILPPANRLGNRFLTNFENPHIGLPSDTTKFLVTNYNPALKLVGVGQPSLAAGVDAFGTYLGGGVALFWSDLLGNYNLATALQVQSGNGFTDISGLVGYMNSAHRLNWGGIIQQVPYYLGGYNVGYGTVNNQPAYIEEDYLYRETNREVSGLLAYPFSEQSRVEFSAGYRNISFNYEVTTHAISLNDGSILINNTKQLPSAAAINLASVSAAYVYDNSFMGATAPLLGTRFRLQVSPNIGNLDWVNVLADFRQYFMPIRPFTLAGRILHVGRYGKSSEDYRLSPQYLGYPGLVRGYEYSSFNSYTPVFNRLIGSKMLIANFELRFPLLGVFHIGPGFYGYFPIDCAFFYDTGVAWSNHQDIIFYGGEKPVSSAGVALRINLFGYAVGEVDYVRPFQRSDVGWIWQFDLIQGF
jgi:Tol biopolymer transport system component